MIRNKNKVIVIGDIMLDQYVCGTVNRISPESPVPVVKMNEEYWQLGGAANVANNIAALGGTVTLLGIIGDDDAGSCLCTLLDQYNISYEELLKSVTYKTNKKVRVLGNNQQIVRMDYNDDQKPSAENLKTLFFRFSQIISDYDTVVISDYAKGICDDVFCQEVINLCQEKDKPVFVDPKGNNWNKYKGAALISPNLKEFSEFIGIQLHNTNKDIETKCRSLYGTLEIEYLMITRSEKGSTLIDKSNVHYHMPSKAREVYDVSGAGDTVIATLSLFWNKNGDIFDAIRLSNEAAGIVVGKRGTATVSEKELDDINAEQIAQISNKIVTIEKLMETIQTWKLKGESIVFTNGCYDIFHKGHAYSIYAAAKFGQHLIVAINSDSSVRRLKGEGRPINSEYDRAYVIAALGCVDRVIIFSDDTPDAILKDIKPDILVKGGDYKLEEVIGREYANRVELIRYIDGYSTTDLIQKIERE